MSRRDDEIFDAAWVAARETLEDRETGASSDMGELEEIELDYYNRTLDLGIYGSLDLGQLLTVVIEAVRPLLEVKPPVPERVEAEPVPVAEGTLSSVGRSVEWGEITNLVVSGPDEALVRVRSQYTPEELSRMRRAYRSDVERLTLLELRNEVKVALNKKDPKEAPSLRQRDRMRYAIGLLEAGADEKAQEARNHG